MIEGAAVGFAAAFAAGVTAIFINSPRDRPRIFFDAILSVGRPA